MRKQFTRIIANSPSLLCVLYYTKLSELKVVVKLKLERNEKYVQIFVFMCCDTQPCGKPKALKIVDINSIELK